MVDRRERKLARRGERLRARDSDEQRADEPRALGDRDGVDVVERGARPRERIVDDGREELQMVTRCDLGDDPAVAVMDSLGGDDVGEQLAAGADDGGARVVAARLDREDQV
jgi:hypothetical protein